MRTFGESAPLQKLMQKFGFTVDAFLHGSKPRNAHNTRVDD
jgi:transketolase